MCFVIGYAVIARKDAFVRTKFGITLLLAGGLSLVPLPPQLTAMDSALAGMSSQLGSLSGMFAWPSSFPKGVYLGLWIATSLAGLLVGMQIWNAGKPGWRQSGASNAWDSSAAGRARAMLPMVNSLAEAVDLIARTRVDAPGIDKIAEELRSVGRRFSGELPDTASAVYQSVVASLPAAVANKVTRYLLEGAGRAGEIASTVR